MPKRNTTKNAPRDSGPGGAWRKAVPVLVLLALAVGIFSYTVKIREPWFGTLSPRHHQWLTGSTVKFEKNWYREGAWNLRFLMLESPASIETPTPVSRTPYPSYPPGTILPIHLLCKALGAAPTPAVVMTYNLAGHLLVALFLGLTVQVVLRRIGADAVVATSLSAVPVVLMLLLPGPLYFHQNVFFSDQAIILPFAVFVFLEVARGDVKGPRSAAVLAIVQSLVFFWGVLTDWFFFDIGLVVYAKRIARREMGERPKSFLLKSAAYWGPSILVMALFALQLNSVDLIPGLIEKFRFRAGISQEGASYVTDFFRQFWKGHFALNFGEIAIYLVWASLLVFLACLVVVSVRRFRGVSAGERSVELLSAIGIYLVPCFLHTYLLKNHSVNHDFAALKFATPIATVPFVLAPILLVTLLAKDASLSVRAAATVPGGKAPGKGRSKGEGGTGAFNSRALFTAVVLVAAAAAYAVHEHPRYRTMCPPPESSYAMIGDFIAGNTGYEDVVFSPYFEIPVNPPQLISYTMKRVYRIGSVDEMARFLQGTDGDYVVNILLAGSPASGYVLPDPGNVPELKRVLDSAREVRRGYGLFLFKVPKSDFAGFLKR